MFKVYWSVGKESVLEQIPARWNKLTDSVHSFICICDFKFFSVLINKIVFPLSISVNN